MCCLSGSMDNHSLYPLLGFSLTYFTTVSHVLTQCIFTHQLFISTHTSHQKHGTVICTSQQSSLHYLHYTDAHITCTLGTCNT
ncbi:hypothetical protein GDO81_016612 [Engystomops pustulosus]|uniref:Uncharacterized protein n=1 Tax=Engystomops pustulosus TaxID=76066 RepID=A0AAV7ADI5_ENGPU|nr:hypothetical protein GDO81_016612 [Engystomops pustulosus]